MNIQLIVAPLVGALIGYITNAIAIKMLFRPVKPIYLGKFRLPLTPGLIPKEKARLARSIGDVVGQQLLSEDSVRRALLAPEMKEKIRGAAQALVEKGQSCNDTLGGLLARLTSPEKAGQLLADGKSTLSRFLTDKLIEADLGATAAHSIGEGVKRNALGDMLRQILSDKIKQSVMQQVQQTVNGYLARHASDLVEGAVDREAQKLIDTRVCDLANQYRDKLPLFTQRLEALYQQLVENNLGRVLGALDIPAIVRNRIESIPDQDLEKLVMTVVDKELKAIVALGALLGFIMGFVNLLFA